jgi:hypothetical protein
MPTTNPLYGKLVVLLNNGVQITNLLSNDLNFQAAMRTVTSKDSNDWEESRPTIKSATLPFTGLVSYDAAEGIEEIYDDMEGGILCSWTFGTGVTGSPKWSGSGYFQSLNFKAPFDGNVEFDGEVKVTGAITKGVY